jgi:ATP-binding cassette subfamily B protein
MSQMQDDGEERAKGYDAALLRRLLGYLRPYRRLGGGALLLLLAQSGLALIGPRLTERALDVAIPRRDAGLLSLLATLYLGTLLLEFVVEYGGTLLTTYVGQRVMYDLRMQLFGHLQRLSITYFDRNPVGRLMTRVTSDVETLNELFSSGVVTIFGDVFTLIAIMGMMLAIDVRLALVTFAVIPLVWLTARVFRRRIREAFRDIRTRLARLNAFLQEQL